MATPEQWLKAISIEQIRKPPKEGGSLSQAGATNTEQNQQLTPTNHTTVNPAKDTAALTVLRVNDKTSSKTGRKYSASKGVAYDGKSVRKLVVKYRSWDGAQYEADDLDVGTFFQFALRPYNGWSTLGPLLDELATDDKLLWVLGDLIDPESRSWRRRLKHDRDDQKAALRDGVVDVMPFDFDGAMFEGVENLDPVADPEACVRAAIQRLPAAFHDASVWWTFTASQQPGRGSALRLRTVFLLSKPTPLINLRGFSRVLDLALHVDPGIYSGNQPIFITQPVFREGSDPLPQRRGFLQGAAERVELPAIVAPAAYPSAGYTARGGVYLPDGHDPLELIGDHEGGAGCYQGLRAASWHLVRLQGDTLAGEDIKALLRQRAASATWNESHGADYVRQQLTDARLDDLIRGAREKLDAKQKLFYDIPPDYPARPMRRELAVAMLHGVTNTVMNEAFADMTDTVTLLEGAAGLGKTTKTLAENIKDGLILHMYVPSFKLANELEALARSMGATVAVMKGRTREDGDVDFPRQMCDKADLAEALAKKGVTNVQSLMCMRVVGERTVKCSSFGHCGYARQFKTQAQVRVYTHAHLALEPGIFERDVPAPHLTVVDEDPIKALITEKSWPLADVRAAGGLVAEIAEIVSAKLPLLHELRVRYDDAVEAVADALAEMEQVALPILPNDHPAVAIKRIETLGAPVSFVALLEGVLTALRSGEDHYTGVWLGADSDKKEWLHLAHLRRPVRLLQNAGKVLLLDATPNVAALRQALGDKPLEVHEVNAERQAVVVQVFDTALSKTRLSNNATLRQDLIGLVAASARQFGSVGVCGPKDVIGQMESTLATQVADGSVVMAHFGNLRGQDALKNTAVGIVIGRQLPRAYDVERMARAIWPHESLTLTGEYVQRPAGYRMRDGSQVGVMVYDHPDARVAAVLRQICDAESSQALDRHRLVHRDVPKLILLVSNQPLDVDVDRLVELEHVVGRAGLASAVMEHGGVLPLGVQWLTENMPGLSSRKAAEHWSARVAKSLAAEHPPHFYKEMNAMDDAMVNPPLSYKGVTARPKTDFNPPLSYKQSGKDGAARGEGAKTAFNPPNPYKGPERFSIPHFPYLYMRNLGGSQPQRLVEYRMQGDRGGRARKAVTCLPGLVGVRKLLAEHHGVDAADVVDLQWADGVERSTMLTGEMPVAPIQQKLLLPVAASVTTPWQGQSLLCSPNALTAQETAK